MKAIGEAVKALRRGAIVAFPTETSYGLACDPFNEKAVRKLHELKREPMDKPVLLIVASTQMAGKIAVLDKRAKKIAKRIMPAPLTLVAQKKKSVPDFLSREKIAFRISSNETARELSHKFGKPITATSANIHGEKPAFTPAQVKKYFGEKVFLLDGGRLKEQKPSTIFDAEKNRVLRKGAISRKRINEALREKAKD